MTESGWPGSAPVVPLPGSSGVTVHPAWAPSILPEVAMALKQKSQQKNISSCFFFCSSSSTYPSRFWKLYMRTSVKEGKMVSQNACKMNINVLNWERSQCEMNGKMRGCRIVLPNACGWDICLRAKFRDILRYSVLQILRCLYLYLCTWTCSCLLVLTNVFNLLCLPGVTFCWYVNVAVFNSSIHAIILDICHR